MKRLRWLKPFAWVGIVLSLAPIGTWILNLEVERLTGIQSKISTWFLTPGGAYWTVRGVSARTPGGAGEVSSAKQVRFRLDPQSLLCRRLIFEELILEDAQLISRGVQLPQVDLMDALEHDQKKFPIEILTGPRDEYWANMVRHLEISGYASQVQERWRSTESALDQKIMEIESHLRSTRSALESYENPLRDIPALTTRQKSMKSLRQELPEIESEVRSHADTFASIASGTDAIRRSDLAKVGDRLEILSKPRQKVAEAIIHDFVAALVERYRHLSDLGLQFNNLTELTAIPPVRGKVIPSARADIQPAWEVRRASFAGELDSWGTHFNILGRIENIVPKEFLASQPTKTRLRLTSSSGLSDVHAVRFKSFPKLMDIVEVQHREQHPQTLVVTLPQMVATLSAQDWVVFMQWERLTDEWIGHLRWRANGVGLQLQNAYTPSATEFLQRANDRLTGVNQAVIDATIRINHQGKACCEWNSDLLKPLRSAFQHAHHLTHAEIEKNWRQLYSDLETEQLAMVRKLVDGEKQSLLSRIDELGREIESLQTELALAIESANSSNRYSRGHWPDRVVR